MSNPSPLTRRNFLTGLVAAAATTASMTKSYGAISLFNVKKPTHCPVISVGRSRRLYNRNDRASARIRVAALHNRRVLIPVSQ